MKSIIFTETAQNVSVTERKDHARAIRKDAVIRIVVNVRSANQNFVTGTLKSKKNQSMVSFLLFIKYSAS